MTHPAAQAAPSQLLRTDTEDELRFTNWLAMLMVLADEFRGAPALTAQAHRVRLRDHALKAPRERNSPSVNATHLDGLGPVLTNSMKKDH